MMFSFQYPNSKCVHCHLNDLIENIYQFNLKSNLLLQIRSLTLANKVLETIKSKIKKRNTGGSLQ